MERLKTTVAWGLEQLLGRRLFARLSRFLWMRSRLDLGTAMEVNGELALIEALAPHLASQPNLVVLDVGAHRGAWTKELVGALEAETAAPSGNVFLFEPAPTVVPLLQTEVARWRSLRLQFHVVSAAVGHEEGKAAFSVLEGEAETNSLGVFDGDRVASTIDVDVHTVDGFCRRRNVAHVGWLKVDAEGWDLDVLRGAETMLAEERIDFVQFEYNQRWIASRSFLKDAFELADRHGYRVGKITPRGIEHYERWHHELESFVQGNYLLWRHPAPTGLEVFPWWAA